MGAFRRSLNFPSGQTNFRQVVKQILPICVSYVFLGHVTEKGQPLPLCDRQILTKCVSVFGRSITRLAWKDGRIGSKMGSHREGSFQFNCSFSLNVLYFKKISVLITLPLPLAIKSPWKIPYTQRPVFFKASRDELLVWQAWVSSRNEGISTMTCDQIWFWFIPFTQTEVAPDLTLFPASKLVTVASWHLNHSKLHSTSYRPRRPILPSSREETKRNASQRATRKALRYFHLVWESSRFRRWCTIFSDGPLDGAKGETPAIESPIFR